MFDKDLFYSLCEKYNVELSDEYDKPMVVINDDEIIPAKEYIHSLREIVIKK